MKKQNLLNRLGALLTLCCLSCVQLWAAEDNPAAISGLLNRIGGSGASDKFTTVVDETLSTGNDVFVITSQDGKPCIKGNTVLSVATGINWYLNHYAKVNIAWNNLTTDLSSATLPVPNGEEKHECSVDYRYYLNYCTFSYSMSTWTWDRWQKEIDWMALHGINMPLQIVGLDVVWKKLLVDDLGYSAADANKFIAGPCFQAWWGMNNLEGWGGANPDWWYTRQEQLAKDILARERELGMQPVLPGYSGMIPSDITEKKGYAANNQGGWCDFVRPYILDPNSAAFAEVSAKYYNRLEEVMGTSQYYSMDPFHEGANTDGIDVASAYGKIADAMTKANADGKWVIQFWQWSGAQYNVLSKVEKGKLIVLDLFSDAHTHFGDYQGHDAVYCMLPNFGGRTGLFGRLTKVMTDFYNQQRNYSNIKGIGATPEAIEQVPVLYDALFELPWYASAPDAKTWLANYSASRYGGKSTLAEAAWEKIRNSALNCETALQGPQEAVLCARPWWSIGAVSSWGGTGIFYDVQEVADAAIKLLNASTEIANGGLNYSYDLTDFSRQALTDYGYYLLNAVKESHDAGDTANYEKRRDAFLQLILDLDELLNTNKNFMLGNWTQMARGIADEVSGTTADDRNWLELNNARTLITTWGDRNQSEGGGLRDYSYREWGGMMKDFYYDRWKTFFDNEGKNLPNWFDHDWAWAHDASKSYSDVPVGNTADVAKKLFEKYFVDYTVSADKTYHIYRYMSTDARKEISAEAIRGNDYTSPLVAVPSGTTAKVGIDFNNDGVIAADEQADGLEITVPTTAVTGKVNAQITLSDGTQFMYVVTLKDEIANPRTVSVATADASQGSVAIEGSTELSVTNDQEVTIKANPVTGYDFVNWTDGAGNVVSNDNPYTYYGADAASFTANFIVNKWGSPTENRGDLGTISDYGQYLTSVAVAQNGGDEADIYSVASCPDALCQTTQAVKVPQGAEFKIHTIAKGEMNYCRLSAYIDLNSDGDFDDEGEFLKVEGGKSTSGNTQLNDYTLTVLLPYDVPEGITHVRMRFDSSWAGNLDDNDAVPAKAETTRMIYDIPVDVTTKAATACTVTVKTSDTSKGTVDANGQPDTYTYKVGEQVVLRCYPTTGNKIDYWTDKYGRKVPESWHDGNFLRFDAPESNEYTAHFTSGFGDLIPINGYQFEYVMNGNDITLTKVASGSGDLTIPDTYAGYNIKATARGLLQNQTTLKSLSIPATMTDLGSVLFANDSFTGAGATNANPLPGLALKGTDNWQLSFDVDADGSKFNQWGSGLFATGDNALADSYDNGFQLYLTGDRSIALKMGWDGKHTFTNCTDKSSFKVVVTRLNGDLTVSVTADGVTDSYTESGYALNDYSVFSSSIPAGVNLNNFKVVNVLYAKDSFAGTGEWNTNPAPGLTLSGSSNWQLDFDVHADDITKSFNDWGSSLFATGDNAFGSFGNGMQIYLKSTSNDGRCLNVSTSAGDKKFYSTSEATEFHVKVKRVCGQMEVTVIVGSDSETQSFACNFGDFSEFSTGVPSGMSLNNITVTDLDVELAPFRGCSKLAEVTVAEGNIAYKAENNVLYSADGTRLVGYPEGRLSHRLELPESVTTIAAGAFTAMPELNRIVASTITPAVAETNAFPAAKTNARRRAAGTTDASTVYVQAPEGASEAYRTAWEMPIVFSIDEDSSLSSAEIANVKDGDVVEFNPGSDAPGLDYSNSAWLTRTFEAGELLAVYFPTAPTGVSVEGLSNADTLMSDVIAYKFDSATKSFGSVAAETIESGAYMIMVPSEWAGKEVTFSFATMSDATPEADGGLVGNGTSESEVVTDAYIYDPATNKFLPASGSTTVRPFEAVLLLDDNTDEILGPDINYLGAGSVVVVSGGNYRYYDVTGREVSKDAKGLIIRNDGKKIIVR